MSGIRVVTLENLNEFMESIEKVFPGKLMQKKMREDFERLVEVEDGITSYTWQDFINMAYAYSLGYKASSKPVVKTERRVTVAR